MRSLVTLCLAMSVAPRSLGQGLGVYHAAAQEGGLVGAVTPPVISTANDNSVAGSHEHLFHIGDEIDFAHHAGDAIQGVSAVHCGMAGTIVRGRLMFLLDLGVQAFESFEMLGFVSCVGRNVP